MGPQVGFAIGLGLVSDDVRVYEVQCCWVGPGSGDIIMTGSLSRESKEAIQWCKAFVETAAIAFCPRLGLPNRTFGMAGHDLHVHINNNWWPVSAAYQMGAIMISMIALLGGMSPRPDTAIFGDMLASGHLASSWTLSTDMIKSCYVNGIRRLIVGEGMVIDGVAKTVADSICSVDGQPYLQYHYVHRIYDAVPLCFDLTPYQEHYSISYVVVIHHHVHYTRRNFR